VTIGSPISVREHFLANGVLRQPAANLGNGNLVRFISIFFIYGTKNVKQNELFELNDRELMAIQFLSLELIERHNTQNVLTIWPVMCLAIIQVIKMTQKIKKRTKLEKRKNRPKYF
jgi:hypothetical protein